MDSLAIYRKALDASVVKLDGARPGPAMVQTIQKKLKPQYAEMLSLPVQPMAPIQDIDPDSETFGLFYFMPGVDEPDDPNHPIL
ncbi:MAG TPA: hypothetical protein VJ835_05275 [Fimbriimonadaceae bacterium]|nr:hypothetical protein [Fimbriimonadaceae bacterium]